MESVGIKMELKNIIIELDKRNRLLFHISYIFIKCINNHNKTLQLKTRTKTFIDLQQEWNFMRERERKCCRNYGILLESHPSCIKHNQKKEQITRTKKKDT